MVQPGKAERTPPRRRRSLVLAFAAALAAAAWSPPSATAGGPVGPSPGPSAGCLVCHGAAPIAERDPSLYVRPAVLAASVHAELSCQSCHGALGAVLTAHPPEKLGEARGSCARCHPAQQRAYVEGAHGAPGSGPGTGIAPPAPPSCVTCHGSHGVRPAGSRAFVVALADRCSGCHAERGEEFYERNYHGKETLLGRRDVAVCTDCHGAHTILGAEDPRSPVSPPNRLATCRRCHPGATANFADVRIHVGGEPFPDDPRLAVPMALMTALLVGVFAFFGAHTALGVWHAARTRREVEG